MSDLVERLRFTSSKYQDTCLEAIDRILELEAALRAVEDISLDSDHEAATMAITAVVRKVLA